MGEQEFVAQRVAGADELIQEGRVGRGVEDGGHLLGGLAACARQCHGERGRDADRGKDNVAPSARELMVGIGGELVQTIRGRQR